MKKVLLRFYSQNNLGDDLFIKIITQRYKNKFVSVTTSKNAYFRSINNLELHRSILLSQILRIVEKIFMYRNIWLSYLTKNTDLMLYVGGSLFIESKSDKIWEKERRFYGNLPIPYYILGSNFGPYESQEFIERVNDIFSSAKDVCFRDAASYNLFKDLQTTRVATDIAFSMKVNEYDRQSEKIAIFSIINGDTRFDSTVTNQYESETIKLVRALTNKGYRIIFMSFCKFEGDEEGIQRILGKMNPGYAEQIDVYNYDDDLEEALELLAKSEIIIAGRFHAAVLGLLFSKKVLPMAYSDKTINLLNDLAFKGDIVDIRNINKFDGSKFDFDAIPITNIAKQVKLAETQFQELDKVLVRRK